MLQQGALFLVVADGRRARVLIEQRRGAALEEPPEWALEISPEELTEAQDRAPRSFDRVGGHRHAMDGGRDLHEEEEERFLKRLADQIGAAEQAGAFAHMVIVAPPRALGRLRDYLPAAAKARIRSETAKDLVDEDAAKLRERLREWLR